MIVWVLALATMLVGLGCVMTTVQWLDQLDTLIAVSGLLLSLISVGVLGWLLGRG